jgi:hypothetical protein
MGAREVDDRLAIEGDSLISLRYATLDCRGALPSQELRPARAGPRSPRGLVEQEA